jgi:hypothetical protein
MRHITLYGACFVLLGCSLHKEQMPLLQLPEMGQITSIKAHVFNGGSSDLIEADYVLQQQNWKRVLEFISPIRKYTSGFIQECPLLCILTITTSDGKTQTYYVRSAGHNPLIVSVDDISYYWTARPEQGGGDSAFGLAAYVQKVGNNK